MMRSICACITIPWSRQRAQQLLKETERVLHRRLFFRLEWKWIAEAWIPPLRNLQGPSRIKQVVVFRRFFGICEDR